MAYCGDLHGVFVPRRHRSVKSVLKQIFLRFLLSVTCLRHVTRLFSSPHNDYLMILHEECEMLRINIKAYSQMFRLSNFGRCYFSLDKKTTSSCIDHIRLLARMTVGR